MGDNKLFTIDDEAVAKTYGYVPYRPSNQIMFQRKASEYFPERTNWVEAGGLNPTVVTASVPTSPTQVVYPSLMYPQVATVESPYMVPHSQPIQGYVNPVMSPYMYPVPNQIPRNQMRRSNKGKSQKRSRKEAVNHSPLQRSYTLPVYFPEAYYGTSPNVWSGQMYQG